MARCHVHTSTPRRHPDPISTQGARTHYKNSSPLSDEPAVHAVGRTCRGRARKTHAGVDGNRRAMVIIVTGGQRHDGVVLPYVLEELRVPYLPGVGRPRVRPDVVIADRAYSSAAHRDLCRRRGIKFVSPGRKARSITADAKAPKMGALPSVMRIGTKIATSSSDSSPVPSSGGALLPDVKTRHRLSRRHGPICRV
ncbi:transposase [Corynebacterium phoceense]|uniref:transposase n=1 Tax=Corynebacterium phoceense TaxID=1686286 RepID=UPI003B96922B